MKTYILHAGLCLCCGIAWLHAETSLSDPLYSGLARDLLAFFQQQEMQWDCEVGIEIDDIAYPPYVPEDDEQAMRVNRQMRKLATRLGPTGALSCAIYQLHGAIDEELIQCVVQFVVFASSQDMQDFWKNKWPEQVREQMVIVDGLGDVCLKRPGNALDYIYLRRGNVYIELKSRENYSGLLLHWLQSLDRCIITSGEHASTNTDPNAVS